MAASRKRSCSASSRPCCRASRSCGIWRSKSNGWKATSKRSPTGRPARNARPIAARRAVAARYVPHRVRPGRDATGTFLQRVLRAFHTCRATSNGRGTAGSVLLQYRPISSYGWHRHLTAANIAEILPPQPSRWSSTRNDARPAASRRSWRAGMHAYCRTTNHSPHSMAARRTWQRRPVRCPRLCVRCRCSGACCRRDICRRSSALAALR